MAKLNQDERIARANKIRQEKEKVHAENSERYLNGIQLKIKNGFTLFFFIYILISFIPFYPEVFNEEQTVTFSDYYRVPKFGPVITISTNHSNSYKVAGKNMDNHSFHVGDTVITRKNILFKTKLICHKKYGLSYPIDKLFGMTLLLIILELVLIILLLSKDYRIELVYNLFVVVQFIVFLIYLFI